MKKIKSLIDLERMVIENMPIDKTTISGKRLITLIWYTLRDLKTNHKFPLALLKDYNTHPMVLTRQGYALRTPIDYQQLLSESSHQYDNYGTLTLLYQLSHINNLNTLQRDEFYQTHQNQLPNRFVNLWNALNHKQLGVSILFDDIPEITFNEYKTIYQQSYHDYVCDSNFSIRLYAHIRNVLGTKITPECDIMVLTLFVTAYIRQHTHQYNDNADPSSDREYSPYRPLLSDLIFSTSPSYEWPNRWFRMTKSYVESDSVRIANPCIDRLLTFYEHQTWNGIEFDEFKAYDEIILNYAKLKNEEFQKLLKGFMRYSDVTATQDVAFDWDDFNYLDLPNLNDDEPEVLI